MAPSPSAGAGTGATDLSVAGPTRQVLLALLADIFAKYERGAAELVAEFGLPEITLELLMAVCLAAPEVDDLVLGFVRDDLRVVSLGDQTRQLVERDVGLLEQEPPGWGSLRSDMSSELARQIALGHYAAAQLRLAQGRATELEAFILQHPDLHGRIAALPPELLVRWIMLSLMRETRSRRRGSRVLAAWAEQLSPPQRARLSAAREKLPAVAAIPQRPTASRAAVTVAPRSKIDG